jgi:hypothetical protein
MKLILLIGGNPGSTAACAGHEVGGGAAWFEFDPKGHGGPIGCLLRRDDRR